MYLLEFAGTDDALALEEARIAASAVEALGPGVGLASDLSPERVRGLAFTRRAAELIGRCEGSLDAARSTLEAASIDRSGSVAVRATNVRGTAAVSTAEAERTLGTVLVDHGFEVDLESPEHVLRAVFTNSDCVLGWQVVESVRDFGDRAPTEKPFFQPGSMDPMLGRAVANLVGAGPGRTILDPMCGTGGVLVEAGLVGATVLGCDVQRRMVAGSRRNLAHFLDAAERAPVGVKRGDWAVLQADATRLPVSDDAADGVVVDVPYGRQSPVTAASLESLVAGALTECQRVAPRAVVVADRPIESAARSAGWRIESSFDRYVHRSLTRRILVLERA